MSLKPTYANFVKPCLKIVEEKKKKTLKERDEVIVLW